MHWQTRRFLIDLSTPRVMGIVNATPDSFSDGGRHAAAALGARCAQLVEEGADLLDIGGESTRPGAAMPPLQEELDRVMPVVRAAVRLGVPVSVDTSRPEVIAAVLSEGVDIINDVRALQWPGALDAVLRYPGTGICLMHMQGEPATMQQAPRYEVVTQEVEAFLAARLNAVVQAGVSPEAIVLDPGYGFGKTLDHNLTLFREQAQLLALGRPLLVGWSRKGTLGQITGRPVQDRLVPSVAAALAAVARGARVVRVHDVAATADALKVWRAAGLA
ncbi:dihydropteroate synthase [Ideonella livida]|uniref:Dihydropteroate synthase n=1 Tax=Ideonella livida TaxID=2707176 RepID=A0A7C9PEH2_9BURK|nr:dihydropteroate synthase [Ideonella livida]NDY89608.1 dihydropteroate synthase [Ideonella livida]